MSWNYCVDLITEITLPHTQLSYLLLSQVGSLRPICYLGGAAWKLTCSNNRGSKKKTKHVGIPHGKLLLHCHGHCHHIVVVTLLDAKVGLNAYECIFACVCM